MLTIGPSFEEQWGEQTRPQRFVLAGRARAVEQMPGLVFELDETGPFAVYRAKISLNGSAHLEAKHGKIRTP